jgi:anti-anti-sigma regulatory factor
MSIPIEHDESSTAPEAPAANVLTRGSEHVLVLEATLSLEHVRSLHEAAMRLPRDTASVVVDCAAAEHLDACTLQVLLALKAELETCGRAFRIAGETADVRKYLKLAGLSAHFPETISQS